MKAGELSQEVVFSRVKHSPAQLNYESISESRNSSVNEASELKNSSVTSASSEMFSIMAPPLNDVLTCIEHKDSQEQK